MLGDKRTIILYSKAGQEEPGAGAHAWEARP
jgi:hypothetical protein